LREVLVVPQYNDFFPHRVRKERAHKTNHNAIFCVSYFISSRTKRTSSLSFL
jgi:hypothetical protein